MRLLLATIIIVASYSFCGCAQGVSDRPPFSQVIAEAEARSHQLHREMESAFDALRANVSANLGRVTSGILTVLMPGIEQVAAHKLHCPTNTTEYDAHELLGWELAYCTLSTDKYIAGLVDGFFDTLQPVQAASVALMSSVLGHVAQANPVDDPAQVLVELERTLDDVRLEFVGERLPALERAAAAVAASVAEMAGTMEQCVADTLLQLDRIVCVE